MTRLSHTFSPALALCFGIQVGHCHDPHNFWINNVPVLKTDEVVEHHTATSGTKAGLSSFAGGSLQM